MEYFFLVLVFFALMFDKLNIFYFFFISIVCHEFGHICACLVCNYKPDVKISVLAIKLKNYPATKIKKFIVLLCGPLVNLLFICLSTYQIRQGFTLNWYVFMCVNLIILLFNMLPVYFMDGGQILRLFFDNCILDKILDIFSFIILFTVVLYYSKNVLIPVITLTLFATYYIINKTDLHFL